MDILIITPSYFPTLSGNAVDVERIMKGLKLLNNKVLIQTSDNIGNSKVDKFKPDVIHAFHAYKSRIAVDMSKKYNVPLVLTFTGTDYNVCLDDINKKEETLEAINYASALTFLNANSKISTSKKLCGVKFDSYVILRNKPILPCSTYDYRKEYGLSKEDFVITLIAGIRSVKNIGFPIKIIKRLKKEFSNIKFVLVGPVLEKHYLKS